MPNASSLPRSHTLPALARGSAVAEATARFSEAQGLAMDSRAGFEPSEADLDIATAASILGRLRCSPGATLIDASGGGAVFVAAASLLGSFSRVVVWSRPGSALRGELDAFANVQRQEGALPDDGPAVDVVDAACLSDFWAHRRVDCRVAAAEALLLSAGDAPGMGGSCASPGTEAARAGHATSTSANGIVSRLGLGARVVVFGGSLEAEGLWLDAEVSAGRGPRASPIVAAVYTVSRDSGAPHHRGAVGAVARDLGASFASAAEAAAGGADEDALSAGGAVEVPGCYSDDDGDDEDEEEARGGHEEDARRAWRGPGRNRGAGRRGGGDGRVSGSLELPASDDDDDDASGTAGGSASRGAHRDGRSPASSAADRSPAGVARSGAHSASSPQGSLHVRSPRSRRSRFAAEVSSPQGDALIGAKLRRAAAAKHAREARKAAAAFPAPESPARPSTAAGPTSTPPRAASGDHPADGEASDLWAAQPAALPSVAALAEDGVAVPSPSRLPRPSFGLGSPGRRPRGSNPRQRAAPSLLQSPGAKIPGSSGRALVPAPRAPSLQELASADVEGFAPLREEDDAGSAALAAAASSPEASEARRANEAESQQLHRAELANASLGALFGPQAGGAMGRAAPPQPLSAAAQSLRHGAQARDRASALRDGSDPAGSSSPQGDVLLRRKASAARARAVPLAELGRPGLQ